MKGAANPSFKSGRHSRYLPANLDALYREALSNPKLIEMGDHIALLEAHMQSVLGQAQSGDPVPKWSNIRDVFGEIEVAILNSDKDKAIAGLERMHRLMDAGAEWDATWAKVIDIMEQLRRMTDTEVKRKKDLNLMVPVDRVVILMAATAAAVKRHVRDPEQVAAVYREIASLHGANKSADGQLPLVGAEPGPRKIIDVGPEIREPAREAKLKRQYRDKFARKPWEQPETGSK